ncbi:MAG: tRNA-dihydrouridine synthase [bacterium]|nr:tRNA-dihydrouridine synthase [bacterium]
MNFWDKLLRPIIGQAPLYDVTDAAFRQMVARYGKPDVMFTEFVSADGLMHPKGREKLLRELYFTEAERPIVAQLFSSRPDKMREAAKFCAELGFDGIDINMGCPDETIEKQGSGANLIKYPELAQELIKAAKECGLPVSVKTRLGYNQIDLDWLNKLLEAKPAALIIHLRTRKEMSKVPAHWEVMPEIMKLAEGSGVLILGNGDIKTPAEARQKCKETSCDGVLIGRAIFGQPWLYNLEVQPPSGEERLKIMLEHTKLFAALYLPGETNTKLFNGHTKSFAVMKKHFKAYVEGFPASPAGRPGAAELRSKLMEANSVEEVEKLL